MQQSGKCVKSVIHWLDFNATIGGMREKRKPCEALDEEATQLPSIKRAVNDRRRTDDRMK